DSALAQARFRRERQILANLEHPNIATLLDGGVTADGRPFLVMEYVEGLPITDWADARRLDVVGRIGLLRQVCAAVHHAHHNLVIHRDLKPANILVTSDGTVKLLDFGIAKLLDEQLDGEDSPITRTGQRALTPQYASPEQVRGLPLTISSDVYSLGVVACELLAGRRPYAGVANSAVELERAILETAPPAPSSLADGTAAELRGERDAERLRRRLHGDIDDIVLTALHPEPSQRYPSAAAVAEEFRLHLSGMPITAHRDWTAYRIRKFLRRNAGTVAASCLGVVALAGGAVSTMVQSSRVQAEQQVTQEVNRFLRVILSSVRTTTGGRDLHVSELLDSAAVRVSGELAGNPEVQAPLEAVIGASYQSLGIYDRAEGHLQEALRLRESLSGKQSDDYIVAVNNLGQLGIERGEFVRADSLFATALLLHRGLHPRPDTMTALLLGSRGSAANGLGDHAASEKLHGEALQILRERLGPRHDLVATSMNNLAVSLGYQGRWAEAESLHRDALVILGGNHPEPSRLVAGAMNSLASALDMQGKTAAADTAYLATLALRRKVLGPTHPDYTFTLVNYSGFLHDLGRHDEAAGYAREILALRDVVLPESHPAIAGALQTLGRSLDQLGDHGGAERALLESLAIRQKYLGPTSWLVGNSSGILGEHYTLMKAYRSAEAALLDADRILVAALGEGHPNTVRNTGRLASLYQAWGHPSRASVQRARLAALQD
ncbi:MAG TPA: serine/threonine-protein kinase, partial [Gemmatimonadales bacterium]|nr:serine/threonine-protein kinase [Gemmatimonadales bacterium]